MGNSVLLESLLEPRYDHLGVGSRSFTDWEVSWYACLRAACPEGLLGLLHYGLRNAWLKKDPAFLIFYLGLAARRDEHGLHVSDGVQLSRQTTVFGLVDQQDVKRLLGRKAWAELCRNLFSLVPACLDKNNDEVQTKRDTLSNWIYSPQVLSALLEFFNPNGFTVSNFGYDAEKSPAWPFLQWFVLLPFQPKDGVWNPLKYEYRLGCFDKKRGDFIKAAIQMYFDQRLVFVDIMARYGLLHLLKYKDLDVEVKNKLHDLAMTPRPPYSVAPVDLEMAAAGENDQPYIHEDEKDLALGTSEYPDAAKVLLADRYRQRVLERRASRDEVLRARREQRDAARAIAQAQAEASSAALRLFELKGESGQ